MRKRITLALIALGCATCAPKPPPEPARPDWTAQQERIWSVVPNDIAGGVAAADGHHLVEKLVTLRGLIASGKAGWRIADRSDRWVRDAMGFDPIDAAAWQAHGVALDGPMGLFALDIASRMIVFKPSDERLARQSFAPRFTCARAGELLACGDAPVRVAGGGPSAWSRVRQDVPAGQLASEVVFFGAVDRWLAGGNHGDLITRLFSASVAASLSLDMADDRIRIGIGYKDKRAGSLRRYLVAEPNTKSTLGALAGSRSALRFRFSPHALWDLARSELDPSTFAQVSGGFQMATGLDLEKDIADNLTGEIVGGYFDDGGLVQILGVRDDERGKRVMERLDSVLWGGLAMKKGDLEREGWSVTHKVETAGGRPAYVFVFDQSKEMAPPGNHVEIHLGSMAGGMVFALSRRARDEVIRREKNLPAALLGSIPTWARRAFESEAVGVIWGQPLDQRASEESRKRITPSQRAALQKTWGAYDPDLAAFSEEVTDLFTLLYDTVGTLEIGADRADVVFDLNLN